MHRRRCRGCAYEVDEKTVIRAGPVLNVWRAPTDNDGIKWLKDTDTRSPLYRWIEAGLDRLKLETKQVTARRKGKDAVGVTIVTEAVDGSGAVTVDNSIDAGEKLPDLPRVGVTMTVNGGLGNIEYFGRGPHENYVDRNTGAAVGLYRGRVEDHYFPYIVPQENGNRTDVRRVSLTDDDAFGLEARAAKPMEMSASYYTAMDLYGAYHTNELEPNEDITLNLDLMQRGLGGGSFGPDTLPKYQIQPGRFKLVFTLKPVRSGKQSEDWDFRSVV